VKRTRATQVFCASCWPLLAAILSGCQTPAPPTLEDTGSTEVVKLFFEGLVKQDWAQSFAVLTAERQKTISLDQFRRQAQAYCKRLGFEPQEVHIRSCEEHGTEAIAHLSLVGHVQGQRKQFRESVVLKKSANRWQVVPPNHFGTNSR
jgi:hypothetical protein